MPACPRERFSTPFAVWLCGLSATLLGPYYLRPGKHGSTAWKGAGFRWAVCEIGTGRKVLLILDGVRHLLVCGVGGVPRHALRSIHLRPGKTGDGTGKGGLAGKRGPGLVTNVGRGTSATGVLAVYVA